MKWQPIETAPKDGTAVLLCWAYNYKGEPIDWRKDPTTAGVYVQAASWHEDRDCDNPWPGAWTVYCDMIIDPELHFQPTHWMPLPAPPCAEGETE